MTWRAKSSPYLGVMAMLAFLAMLAGGVQALAQDSLIRGKSLFEDNCAPCHRESGLGLPPTFPALKGNSLVLGDSAPLIDVVLGGRKGLSTMPAWKGQLDNQQLADILSYVRASWGNQAAAVTPDQVGARNK